MRISRPQMFMDIAHIVAKRATCMRLSVGAVLVHERSIVAIGYNGVPAGHAHCSGNDCPGRYRCEETIHAEVNALNHLPKGMWSGLDLYVTDSPCPQCWDLISREGKVKRVFFGTPYRVTEHLDMKVPHESRPELYRITPSGYVLDWRTKELVDVET